MALNNDWFPDSTLQKKDDILDHKGNNGSGSGVADAEKGNRSMFGFGTSDKSVGVRIAPVLPHLQAYDFGSDDSGSDILGKQIELEAGNAIQYRTCSWQKVSLFLAKGLPITRYHGETCRGQMLLRLPISLRWSATMGW